MTKEIVLMLLVVVSMLSCTEENQNIEITLPQLSERTTFTILNDSVEIVSEIISDGGAPILQKGICWAIDYMPDTSSNNIILGYGTGPLSYKFYLTGRGNYIFRPYAVNSAGITYGEEVYIYDPGPLMDYSFLWLLGSTGETKKHWVLDTAGVFFTNPLDFYADTSIAYTSDNTWPPFGGTDFYSFNMKGPEVGYINFTGYYGVKSAGNDTTIHGHTSNKTFFSGDVVSVINGEVLTGYFDLFTYSRPKESFTFSSGKSLWEEMLEGSYSCLNTLSDEMATLTLSEHIRFPMDSTTIEDNRITRENLHEVTIMHLSDSALVIRMKGFYDPDESTPLYYLYNYICEEYDYTGQ